MVAVTKRHVAVLFVQWAQDVKLLVDHLQEGRGGGPEFNPGQRLTEGSAASPKLTEIRKNTMQEREKPLV